jgi:metallo-beta-lactamase class B
LLMIASFTFAAAAVASLLAQNYTPENKEWNQPVEPFRIEGNLYYVGANDVTSFLLTSDKGHVLIDSGFRETVPQIVANVTKLGFKMTDIKYLLITQAHYDHAAGLAELKRITKGKLLASVEDARLLARGGKGDFAFQDHFLFEPVTADRTIADGEKLQLSGINMKAYLTPGHTKGCTTWTAQIGTHNAVFLCSVSAPGYKLKSNKNYPNIVADFERTFDLVEKLPCDIFLSAHAAQFKMAEKRAAGNQFVKQGELAEYIRDARQSFHAQLAKEKD